MLFTAVLYTMRLQMQYKAPWHSLEDCLDGPLLPPLSQQWPPAFLWP
jgi:hypothetical protein